ncbi:hypothetical protein Mal52_28730 [Symmachiella dynata]|uniref:DUF304 domain-containing protein n=1 Tax=Symmachiella dynata TaxID=2527995 RepID=A0A517ZPI6_9PLAN|nr:hypothetical protein [Symmachiella dynata]QDU44392.1 hypothetical protein Mal52_28730 [Symmachiella dynata]
MARKRRSVANSKRKASAEQDPLGKLLKVYRPAVGSCFLVIGLGFIIGVLCVAFAAFLVNNTLVTGIAIALALLFLIGTILYSVINYRQRLEFHKGGLRYTKGRALVEIVWHDIINIQAGRSNAVGYGPLHVLTRSEDAEARDDLLTESFSDSFWDVTIVDVAGQTIYLNQMFMTGVKKPRKFIHNLRNGAGLQAGEVR